MSFASDSRGEIARDAFAHVCCARSEMAAALLASGGISFRGRDRYALSLTAAEGAVVRRYFAMLKQFWSVTAQIRTLVVDALGGRTRPGQQVARQGLAGLDQLRVAVLTGGPHEV